jgi:signal peptidase I
MSFPFFPVLIVALVVSTVPVQPFLIASESMAPTLQEGDKAFVAKYPAGDSSHSPPGGAAAPARGDVVAFIPPNGPALVFFKRVVGLPGERIQMKEGQLYINDKPVIHENVQDFVGQGACGTEQIARVKRWRETLPNGVSYETLDCVDNGFYDNTNVYTVPSGSFFMLGDNRDNSTDSRMLSQMGYLPLDSIIGRLDRIVPGPGRGK